MPTWLPEGNVARPGGDEMRTASQWLSLLYDFYGNQPTFFPEGVRPLPSDDLQRIYEKIAFLEATAASGSGAAPCVPPTAPNNLQAVAAGAFVIDFTWSDNSSDETGFDIRWRNVTTASGFTNEPSVAANSTSGQITVTGATDGDTIEVQVRASGVGCDSDWASDEVIVIDTN